MFADFRTARTERTADPIKPRGGGRPRFDNRDPVTEAEVESKRRC